MNGGQEADVIAMLGVPLSVWYMFTVCTQPFLGPAHQPAASVSGGNNPSLCQHLHGQASFLFTFSSLPLSRQFLSAWKHKLPT